MDAVYKKNMYTLNQDLNCFRFNDDGQRYLLTVITNRNICTWD